MKNNICIFVKYALIILSFLILYPACRLGGDVEALRPEKPSGPAIPAPGIPKVISSDRLITVNWNAVEEAENYEVYLSASTNPPASPIRTVSATTVVLDGLVNKTAYYVWIKAKDETRFSDYSPRGRGIPWPVNEIPSTPNRPVIIP